MFETSPKLTDFNFDLPDDRIARFPTARREAARLMVLNRGQGTLQHQHFYDLPQFIHPGDLLVVNNTRVLNARFKSPDNAYEVFLLEPANPQDPTHWRAMFRPQKKCRPGMQIPIAGCAATFEVLPQYQGVRVHLNGVKSVHALMAQFGQVPIPPYLKRSAAPTDQADYQTVYAKVPGSLAAPTAGLHFTTPLLDSLRAEGVGIAEVTLSVSTGTFRTIKDDDYLKHQMDPEWFELPAETATAIQATKARGGRVIAVGTTSAKTIETVAKAQGGQVTAPLTGQSDLFIYPGVPFHTVDALITNFHLPKSTLMLLVSAFASRELIMSAYETAVAMQYRFFSYGDAMLIE
jgi:S-adenosylmethionine:tRNA ribosyltransferase-isomerase